MNFNINCVKTNLMKTFLIWTFINQYILNYKSILSTNSRGQIKFLDKGFYSKLVFCLCNKRGVLGLQAIQQSH